MVAAYRWSLEYRIEELFAVFLKLYLLGLSSDSEVLGKTMRTEKLWTRALRCQPENLYLRLFCALS
jgi:hypothetical protein